jgi:hypothetical protein
MDVKFTDHDTFGRFFWVGRDDKITLSCFSHGDVARKVVMTLWMTLWSSLELAL